ncbi:MAG: hypothetical protein IKJ19_07140 [Clostridia bacterium]|nr:hypothetical protein [Clostridia bacterium]
MTNLVFLKGDLKKFIVRVSTEGFIKCCLKYKASPRRIAKLNNLSYLPEKGELVVFEILNTFLYEVKPNENFECICNKFSVSEDELFDVNLTREFYPWQIIEIPKKTLD